jgi:hypothetical protein
MGKWKYFSPRHKVEVNPKLHGTAALPFSPLPPQSEKAPGIYRIAVMLLLLSIT